jgi:hypothetical protein
MIIFQRRKYHVYPQTKIRQIQLFHIYTAIIYTINKFNQQEDFPRMRSLFSEFDYLFFNIQKPEIATNQIIITLEDYIHQIRLAREQIQL